MIPASHSVRSPRAQNELIGFQSVLNTILGNIQGSFQNINQNE